jgi:hypothetical protein
MALQIIVQAEIQSEIAEAMGPMASSLEVFQVSDLLWGVSVPSKVIESVGENQVRMALSKFNVYDLYGGEWKNA